MIITDLLNELYSYTSLRYGFHTVTVGFLGIGFFFCDFSKSKCGGKCNPTFKNRKPLNDNKITK